MGRDARQDVGQPSLRIDAVHLGGDYETVHGRRALPAAIVLGLLNRSRNIVAVLRERPDNPFA